MKLRGRISFHFLIQFFILFTVSFLVIIGLLILLVNFITNDELKTNPKESVIENTPTFVIISDDKEVSINDKWKKQLKENHMWLQIINKQGKVIHEENASSDLEAKYNINELLEIEETNRLNEYTAELYYDEWLEDSYYFLFGYENVEEEQLKAWHETFGKEGRIDSAFISELEDKLKPEEASIEIYEDGELVQTVGAKTDEKAERTEILSSIHSPGKQKSKAFTYTDDKNDTAWVYRVPNENYS